MPLKSTSLEYQLVERLLASTELNMDDMENDTREAILMVRQTMVETTAERARLVVQYFWDLSNKFMGTISDKELVRAIRDLPVDFRDGYYWIRKES